MFVIRGGYSGRSISICITNKRLNMPGALDRICCSRCCSVRLYDQSRHEEVLWEPGHLLSLGSCKCIVPFLRCNWWTARRGEQETFALLAVCEMGQLCGCDIVRATHLERPSTVYWQNTRHLVSREGSARDAGQTASNTGRPALYGTVGNPTSWPCSTVWWSKFKFLISLKRRELAQNVQNDFCRFKYLPTTDT